MKDELQVQLAGIEVGRPESYNGQIRPILANANIFGSDLCALGMADQCSRKCLFPSWQAKAQCAERLKLIWGKKREA